MAGYGSIDSIWATGRYEWKVLDFTKLTRTADYFCESPSFIFANTSFRLQLFPGCSKRGFVSVTLINESGIPFLFNCTIAVKRSDGVLVRDITREVNDTRTTFNRLFCTLHLWKNPSGFIPSDIFTISLELHKGGEGNPTIPPKETEEEIEQMLKEEREAELASKREKFSIDETEALSKDFKQIFVNGSTCDTTLLVQDKAFKVHRAVLVARSPVFEAMFQHDTLERQTGIITISDSDPITFSGFLEYLYCGRLKDLSLDQAVHLYAISDKYQVCHLRAVCIKYMVQHLVVQNVCDMAILADKYDEKELFSAVQNFFNKHLTRIVVTVHWENLMKENSVLANKLILGMSQTTNR